MGDPKREKLILAARASIDLAASQLETLETLDTWLIKQDIEHFEMMTGIETENSYLILGAAKSRGADGGGPCAEPFGKHAGGFYHTDALASGAADVATLAFYNFEVIEARGRGRGLDDVDFFSLKDYGVPFFCQLVLFTTPQRLETLADPLRRLVLAMRRATGLIKQDPKRARAI
ncbi:NMT1/THI5 like-domain-containing protein [Pelagophyceae sp. CCMP2097]|nr:NMT1/THI5 like-domain-containing protein [Pelagophyceae sp. CCMP2097]